MSSRNDFLHAAVAFDVGVREDVVFSSRHEENGRFDPGSVFEIVIRKVVVLRIVREILHGGVVSLDHFENLAVVVHRSSSVEVAAAFVGDVVEVLVFIERRASRTPHHAEHMTGGIIAFTMNE